MILLVPGAGLEPARSELRGILSPGFAKIFFNEVCYLDISPDSVYNYT